MMQEVCKGSSNPQLGPQLGLPVVSKCTLGPVPVGLQDRSQFPSRTGPSSLPGPVPVPFQDQSQFPNVVHHALFGESYHPTPNRPWYHWPTFSVHALLQGSMIVQEKPTSQSDCPLQSHYSAVIRQDGCPCW